MNWIDATAVFETALWVVLAIVIATGLLQNGLYLVQLVLAPRELSPKPRAATRPALAPLCGTRPPIALLVPPTTRRSRSSRASGSMLALNYPHFRDCRDQRRLEGPNPPGDDRGLRLVPVERTFERDVRHKPIRGLYGARRVLPGSSSSTRRTAASPTP